MDISFEGQVAVVTGGGGGIGRMQALELGRRGDIEQGVHAGRSKRARRFTAGALSRVA